MSSRMREAKRELRASQQVLAERIIVTADSRRRLEHKAKATRPGWLIGSALGLGLVVGALPGKAVVAALSALGGLAIRLLNTPLGPMAIGAALSRGRGREDGQDARATDPGPHAG